MTTRIRVAAGILSTADGHVLIADRRRSRSMQDYWEFPGGKLHEDETSEQALARELSEELGVDVVHARHFQHLRHNYDDLKVAIDFFLVDDWQGEPCGVEGQQLKWIARSQLDQVPLLPADMPVVEALKSL
jgi:8-oxo-dGTP diphosphatase